MRLQTARAVYKDGALVFADPELAPRDGTEVIITYLEKFRAMTILEVDPIQALRGNPLYACE